MSHRAVAIANEFLRQPGALGQLTQMQLQKLTYFAHGWNWALNDQPLVSDELEAWAYGPVYRDLYDHTKFFGKEPVERLIAPSDSEVARFFGDDKPEPAYRAALSDRERQIVQRVWKRYGTLSAGRLSALTHQPGTPWYHAFKRGKSSVIDQEMIRQHYKDIAARAA